MGGQVGEPFIELGEGYKAKRQRPYENHGQKHDVLRNVIERNVKEFVWLEGCMTSKLCCASFTIVKQPPAEQNTIDRWWMVVDVRNLTADVSGDGAVGDVDGGGAAGDVTGNDDANDADGEGVACDVTGGGVEGAVGDESGDGLEMPMDWVLSKM